jgi:hypothetical protein
MRESGFGCTFQQSQAGADGDRNFGCTSSVPVIARVA